MQLWSWLSGYEGMSRGWPLFAISLLDLYCCSMRAELASTEQGSSVWAQSKHEVNNLLLLSRASKIQKKDEIAVEQPQRCTMNHSLCFLPIWTDWEQFYTPVTQQQKSDTVFCWEGGEEERDASLQCYLHGETRALTWWQLEHSSHLLACICST